MKTKLKYFAAGAALLLAGACKHMEDVQPQVSLPQSIKMLVQQDAGTKSIFTGEKRDEYATGWEPEQTIWLTEIFTGTPKAGGEDDIIAPYPTESYPLDPENIDNGKATFSFDLSFRESPELGIYSSYKFQYLAGTYTLVHSFPIGCQQG